MRWTALALLLLLVASAGCIGPPTVRVAKVTESFSFDERAPAEAVEALVRRGCLGTHDAETARLVLVRKHDVQPTFVMLMERAGASTGPQGLPDPAAGTAWPMAAGSGGGFPGMRAVDRWMNERGSSGAWGHGSPFRTEETVELTWDRDGARFAGEPLREGEVVRRSLTHEVTQFNATFTVTQTFEATYLGRVPYTIVDACPE